MFELSPLHLSPFDFIEVRTVVPVRKHRKNRIQKKYLKKYGVRYSMKDNEYIL